MSTPGSPYLYVNVNCLAAGDGLYAYRIDVELNQEVILVRDPSIKATGTTYLSSATWDVRSFGTVGANILRNLREAVKDHVDQFINAYLSVNPRQAGATKVVKGPRMEFLAIPPGEFTMGCSPGDSRCDDDEKPSHRVRITQGFEMGKYEVTQAQWEAVMGNNPSRFRGADRPVEAVSWNEIREYLGKLNARNDGYHYRLATEAEWDYAARAVVEACPAVPYQARA